MTLLAAIRESTVVPLLIVGGVALTGLLIHLAFVERRKRCLQAVADRFGGQLLGNSWSGYELVFAVDGVPGGLSYQSGDRKYQMTLRWDFTPQGSLRIGPEGFVSMLRKIFGAKHYKFHDPEFDERFLVLGDPEAWVREVLDPEGRRSVARLAQLTRGANALRISAGPAGVSVTSARDLTARRERLLEFVSEAVALFRRIRIPTSEGVTILSAVELAGSGKCPVCATVIEAAPRRCGRCGTPHHEDCWSYVGGCAIYGCSRRRAA